MERTVTVTMKQLVKLMKNWDRLGALNMKNAEAQFNNDQEAEKKFTDEIVKLYDETIETLQSAGIWDKETLQMIETEYEQNLDDLF